MGIDELKQQIKKYIKTNGNGEITGQVLQDQLLAMIPYTPPMEIYSEKYYKQDGQLYKCTRDSEQALTHNLAELILLWVEKYLIMKQNGSGMKAGMKAILKQCITCLLQMWMNPWYSECTQNSLKLERNVLFLLNT